MYVSSGFSSFVFPSSCERLISPLCTFWLQIPFILFNLLASYSFSEFPVYENNLLEKRFFLFCFVFSGDGFLFFIFKLIVYSAFCFMNGAFTFFIQFYIIILIFQWNNDIFRHYLIAMIEIYFLIGAFNFIIVNHGEADLGHNHTQLGIRWAVSAGWRVRTDSVWLTRDGRLSCRQSGINID